jgi:hypothetical protein
MGMEGGCGGGREVMVVGGWGELGDKINCDTG